MDIYQAKANYERLEDKVAKALGSDRYFIKNDKVVKIDDAFDLFMDLIVIRDATKEEINEAIFNLEKTMNALKKVDSSTKDDNTSKGNTSSKDNQVITSTKNDKKQSSTAKTGDETNIILFVLMAFMSWLGIKKVKKEEL